MNIYIDIDNTICNTDAMRYEDSTPNVDNINKANKLYDDGHVIVYWTARGSVTGKDWSELTKSQLDSWGVKYDKLEFGKPAYDLFICDKVLNIKDWK